MLAMLNLQVLLFKMDFSKVDSEDGDGLGSCPFAGFSVISAETASRANRDR